MKPLKLALLILFFTPVISYAQFESQEQQSKTTPTVKQPVKKKKEPFSEKLVVGGGLDFALGNIISIGVTPLIGYELTETTLIGGAFTYRYFENRTISPSYSTNTFGAAPFIRQHFLESFFVHAEYEFLNGQWAYNRENQWVENFLVGGGYRSYVGDSGFFSVYLLWNVSEDPQYSIYNNPIIRMNFGVAL